MGLAESYHFGLNTILVCHERGQNHTKLRRDTFWYDAIWPQNIPNSVKGCFGMTETAQFQHTKSNRLPFWYENEVHIEHTKTLVIGIWYENRVEIEHTKMTTNGFWYELRGFVK